MMNDNRSELNEKKEAQMEIASQREVNGDGSQ